MKYVLDAKNKRLGRIASEAAILLMGKNSPDYTTNRLPICQVEVVNVSGLNISEKKMNTKEYKSFSGYPGGLKKEKMVRLISKKGRAEIIKNAVYGMLPKNKLRDRAIKNLIVKD